MGFSVVDVGGCVALEGGEEVCADEYGGGFLHFPVSGGEDFWDGDKDGGGGA